MSEQIPDGPRRGRRDVELEAYLDDVEADTEEAGGDVVTLHEGNTVMARMTLQHPTAVGDGWFTYGATTTVSPEEDADEAAERLHDFVTSQVYGLIDSATTTVEQAVDEQRQARRKRRNPRAVN